RPGAHTGTGPGGTAHRAPGEGGRRIGMSLIATPPPSSQARNYPGRIPGPPRTRLLASGYANLAVPASLAGTAPASTTGMTPRRTASGPVEFLPAAPWQQRGDGDNGKQQGQVGDRQVEQAHGRGV